MRVKAFLVSSIVFALIGFIPSNSLAATKKCNGVKKEIQSQDQTLAVLAKQVDQSLKKALNNNSSANLDDYFMTYSSYAEAGRLIYTYAISNPNCFSPSQRVNNLKQEKKWWERSNFIDDFSQSYNAISRSLTRNGRASNYTSILKNIYGS